jgi:HK97 family phage portal protein
MKLGDLAGKFSVTPMAAEVFAPPSPGMSARLGWTTAGALPMAQSMGVRRWATYRSVYQTNPWVWASVQMLSKGIARLPLHTFSTDANGHFVRERGDVTSAGRPSGPQQLDKLLRNGFSGLSRNAMFGGTMIDRLVYGNALWMIQRDTFGSPNGFKRIRWRDMLRVIPDADGMPLAYEWRPWNGYSYGPVTTVVARDVIHFGSGSDPEGLYGLSPLESCRHTLALHDALVRHLVAFFSNSARPSGFVSIDKDINKSRSDEIRQLLIDLYASPENAGKIIAASGATWQEMGKAPDQSAIVELVKLSREEIAAAYAVPPPVLGILDQAIKSNVKELREQFGRDSLGPWASDFEGEFAAQLLPQQPSWSGLSVRFDMGELLRPDLEALALVIQRVSPQMTLDEIRTRYLGLEPLNMSGLSDVPWGARGTAPITTFVPVEPSDSAAEDEVADPPATESDSTS